MTAARDVSELNIIMLHKMASVFEAFNTHTHKYIYIHITIKLFKYV